VFRRRRHVDTVDTAEVALAEARRRFGGIDLPAALAGMLAALGTTVLLAGLAGAAGSVGYEQGADDSTLTSAGLVTGMVVLFLSFMLGGWVAGRMARYDGILNGTLSAALFLILAGGLAALGSWLDAEYDFFGEVNLPQWFSDTSTETAVGSAVIGIVVVLLAAGLGGAMGSGYHRRADRVIAVQPPVGMTRTDEHYDRTDTDRSDLVRGDADVDLDRSHAREYGGRHSAR
jgi:hypothetical protein